MESVSMNLTIEKTDEIYAQVENSKLSLRDLVILGLQTSQLIKDTDYENREEIKNPEPAAPNWEVLNEIQTLKLMLGGSANKGKAAEGSIQSSLSKFFPDIEIDAIGYESGKGDIVMNFKDFKIMIEVKNYSINVPTREQDKFHRDLISNDYKAAIMVSCNSGIVGHTNQFDYKTIGDKFAIYLSNSGNDAMSVMWAVLFVKSSLGLINKISQDNKDNQELISTYVENKLKIIKDCIEDNTKMRENIFNMKSTIIRTLDNSIEHLIQAMNISKNRLQSLVENFNELIDSGKLSTDLNILYSDTNVAKTLEEHTVKELQAKAKELGIKKVSTLTKPHLLDALRPFFSIQPTF
jgi:hypothetical protein